MDDIVYYAYWIVGWFTIPIGLGFAWLLWRDWRGGRSEVGTVLLQGGISLSWISESASKLWFSRFREMGFPDHMIDAWPVAIVTWGLVLAALLHYTHAFIRIFPRKGRQWE